MLFPSGNPDKCHEEVLYLQPMFPHLNILTFSPLSGGCSEGLNAFRFFFKQEVVGVGGPDFVVPALNR